MALKNLGSLTSDERKSVINSLVAKLSDAERKELSSTGKLTMPSSGVETPDWSINIACGVVG